MTIHCLQASRHGFSGLCGPGLLVSGVRLLASGFANWSPDLDIRYLLRSDDLLLASELPLDWGSRASGFLSEVRLLASGVQLRSESLKSHLNLTRRSVDKFDGVDDGPNRWRDCGARFGRQQHVVRTGIPRS